MINQSFLIPLSHLHGEEKEQAARNKAYALISESLDYFDHRNVVATPTDYYSRKSRNAYCRKVWNNTSPSSDLDYLYSRIDKRITDPISGEERIIKLTTPAIVRRIPIVRPMLQSLISRMNDRPLRPRVYSVGTEAVQGKLDAHIKRLADIQMDKLRQRMIGVSLVRRGIALQEQLLAQMEQAQQQQYDPRMEQVLSTVHQSIEEAKIMAQRDIRLSEQERYSVSNYFKYSYKDLYEGATEGMLYEYINRHNLNRMRVEGFEEKMVTDETYLGVWWDEGMTEPSVNIIRPENITYPINDSASHVRDLDWCVIHQPMHYAQIVENYGHKLTKEQLKLLQSDTHLYSYGSRRTFPFGTTVWDTTLPDGRPVQQHSDYADMRNRQVATFRSFWKEVVKLKAVERFFNDGKKYYDPVPDSYKPKAGEKIVNKVRCELWTDISLGYYSKIHIDTRRCTWQPRPIGKPGAVYLPIAGRAVSRFNQPNSHVWTTRDIQELFDILHYTEEKLVVLSGVKGITYDLSQKPENMSEQEVIYYMKQGVMFIQTVSEDNKRKNSTYNQFQTYDQTLSPSIAALGNMKASLIELTRMITGVAPQLQGQIAPTDQVGTSQMALAMSTASVEHLFQDDGVIWQQALELLANVFPIVYRGKGARKIWFDGTKQNIVSYPSDIDGEFTAIVESGSRAHQAIERAKIGIEQSYQKGVISLSQLIKLQDLQSIQDMEVAIADFEDKARTMAEQSQSQQMQQQMTLQQQVKQMDQQMEIRLKQFDAQIKERMAQMQAQVELQKEQMRSQQAQAQMAQVERIEQMKDNTKRYDIETNTMIEASYLELEKQKIQNEDATSRLDRTLSHIEAGMKLHSDVRKAKGKARD